MKLTDDNILQANIDRTKQYVRDYGGKVSTLPTATSSNVGQIYQYTGATTLTYTHGYFYECKQNGGTYSWENVPVGAGDIQIQSDWNQTDNTQKDYIKNKPIIPSAQVNADWTASSGVAEILHKPALGTASALDVATSGNASTSQVVKGDDTRLTDSRNAADVYSWAKAENKPSYTASEVGAIASTDKGANNGVAELDSTGKVPSSQLPSYVDDVLEYNSQSAFPSTGETGKIYIAKDTNKSYRWSGTAYVEISESLALGETSSTAYAGNKGKANADAISAIKDGSTIDSFGDVESALSDKISKSSTAGLVKNDGTIDTTSYVSDISGKADKVSSATNNNFAALDANGNLKDSGHKHSDYLTQHQDISGKADKVSGATSGNVATLDANGNLVDSGKTLGKSVPSNAVFTDAKVLQTNNDTSRDDYYLLYGNLSSTATEGTFKSSKLKFNPSTGNLQTQEINGVTVGSSPKFTDSGHTILNGSGSAMNQRGKLQFVGVTVTDDSANDKTVVTLPSPDYVDEQFNPSTTYSLGMTCIEGNVRYRYKNSTATSGHRPPDTTYWEVFSVTDEFGYTYIDTVSVTATAGQTKSNVKNVNIDVSKYKYFILDYDVGGEKYSGFFINLYNNSSSNPDMYVRNYNPDTNYGNRSTAQVNVANGYMTKLEVGIVNHATQISRTCTLKVYGLQ